MTTLVCNQVILLQGGQGEPITLSPLLCPFPPELNQFVEHAHAHTLAWALAFQLVQPQSKQLARLNAARFAWLAAGANPAFSLDHLQLATDWITWLACYDDLCDAATIGRNPEAWWTMSSRLLAIVQGEAQPDQVEPLACALTNLCQRLRQRTSASWLERFAHDVQQSFQANRWEAAVHASGATPDLATYTKMRRLTSAVYTCFDLVAISAGINPHTAWLDHAYIKQLESMANNHICWINDLFGLAKEMKENNRNNLVLVLQQEFQVSLQAAVDRVVALCNAEMKAFLALAALFSSEACATAPGCQLYITNLQTWMRGNLDWYAQTGRYQAQAWAYADREEPSSALGQVKRQKPLPSSVAVTPPVANLSCLPCSWTYAVLRDELLALS